MLNWLKSNIKRKINNNFIYDFINSFLINDNININELFDFMVKNNFISINIHHIFNGTKNKRKFIISILNLLFLYQIIILLTCVLFSNKLLIWTKHPLISFDQMRLLMFNFTFVLLLIITIKIDFLYEEKRNNLNKFKFFYYLMVNDQTNHQLDDRNYKILKLFIRLFYLFFIKFMGKYLLPVVYLIFLILFFISKLLVYIFIITPIFIYSYYIFFTTLLSFISLFSITCIYYLMRFNQIKVQILCRNTLQR